MPSDFHSSNAGGFDQRPAYAEFVLQRRNRWGIPLALWLVVLMAVTTVPMVILLAKIQLENTVNGWLPANDPQRQVLNWFQEEFEDDEAAVITWDSSTYDDVRMAALANELSRPEALEVGIHQITTPQDVVQQIVDGGISEGEARRRLSGVLTGSGANAPVAMLAHIRPSDASHEEIVQCLKQATRTVGIPDSELHLAGGPVTSAALNDGVRSTQWNPKVEWWQVLRRSPSIASALVSVLLALVLLRSLRLAGMVLFVSIFTAAVTTALIPLSGGTLNMVLVVIPTLMTVLTLSGAIHLVNYWKHATLEDRATAIGKAQQTAAQPCLLAAGTTAIGMLSLLSSDLTPVRDFGIFSAIGVVFSVVMVLFGLPALLILWSPSRVCVATTDTGLWRWLSRLLVRRHILTLVACMVVTIAAGAKLGDLRTETRLIRFFPTGSKVVGDHEFLESRICGLIPVEIALTFDSAAMERLSVFERCDLVRKLASHLRELSDISGTLSFADFCRGMKKPDESAPRLQRAVYGRVSSEIEKRIAAQEGASRDLARIARTALEVPNSPGSPRVIPGMEVWRVNAWALALSSTDFGDLMNDIQRQMNTSIAGQSGVQAFITGTAPLFLRTQEAVLLSLLKSFGLAFVLIEIVLVIQLKGLRAGSLAMIPNVAPIVLVFGLLAWLQVPIDIGSMVTASVALGIAMDGTVHLLTWFENAVRRGLSREEAVVQSLVHCGTAMWHTTAIICLGLLVLLVADLLLVSRFGWLMASLCFAALLGDILLLPALLVGSLGRLIEERVRREIVVTVDKAADDPTVSPQRTPAIGNHISSQEYR